MEKVLITGGAGFIGSHAADKLLENNYQITIIDNLSSGNLNNLQNNPNLKFYNLDIIQDNIESIFKTEQPDYVIHLAAQTSVAYSVANPNIDATMNILGSIKILELSKKYNIKKIIAASSAAVYGIPQYLPIDEKHPTEPISQYGLSKLTMEKYIQLSGVPYIIFRFSNVYGPRQQSSKESGVIAIFNKSMQSNKPINIFGNGKQIRDFVYVEDIAIACTEALKSNVTNEIFNVSTNCGITLNELFTKMKKLYNYKLEANYLPERDGEIRDSILQNQKISKFIVKNNNNINDGLLSLKNYYTTNN